MLAETQTTERATSPTIASRALKAAEEKTASEHNQASTTLDQLEVALTLAEADWLREADRTDSVKAEREGREVTEEDEAIWSAASAAHWAAVDALVAYQPRSAADFLRKARLLTNEGDTRLRAEDQFADLYLKDAEAVAQMALDAILTIPDLKPAWDSAFARFEAAAAAYSKTSAEWDGVYEGLVERAPKWNREPRLTDGRPSLRWFNLKNFETDHRGLPHMRKGMEEWCATEEAALADLDRLGKEIDGVYDQLCDAERALIETPAPDLAVVLFKQQMYGRETDDQKVGYTDPAYAAARRDESSVADSWPLWIHEDLLRLAGVPDPLLTADHFRPRLWNNRFNEAGGKVSVTPIKHELKIEMPRDPAAAAALLTELAAPGATETLTRYLTELLQ